MSRKMNEDELDNLRNGVCGHCSMGELRIMEDSEYGVIYLECDECGRRVDQPDPNEDQDGYDAFEEFIDDEEWMELPEHLKYP